MSIHDLKTGTKINIQFSYKGEQFSHEATILSQYGEGVLITPIYHEGNVINYSSDAKFELTDPFTNLKKTFIIDSLSHISFSDSDFHVIQGKEIMLSHIRRKAERYHVQREVRVITNKKKELRLVINDLSASGLSIFVGNNDYLFNVGDEITVEIKKDDAFKYVKVTCDIVRKFKIGNYSAIGCRVNNIPAAFLEYLNYKKRQKQALNDSRMFTTSEHT